MGTEHLSNTERREEEGLRKERAELSGRKVGARILWDLLMGLKYSECTAKSLSAGHLHCIASSCLPRHRPRLALLWPGLVFAMPLIWAGALIFVLAAVEAQGTAAICCQSAGCVEVEFLSQLLHFSPLAQVTARRRYCCRPGPICPGIHNEPWQKQQRVGSGRCYPSLFVDRRDVFTSRWH